MSSDQRPTIFVEFGSIGYAERSHSDALRVNVHSHCRQLLLDLGSLVDIAILASLPYEETRKALEDALDESAPIVLDRDHLPQFIASRGIEEGYFVGDQASHAALGCPSLKFIPHLALVAGVLAGQPVVLSVLDFDAASDLDVASLMARCSVASLFESRAARYVRLAYACEGSLSELESAGIGITELLDEGGVQTRLLYRGRGSDVPESLAGCLLWRDRFSSLLGIPADWHPDYVEALVMMHSLAAVHPPPDNELLAGLPNANVRRYRRRSAELDDLDFEDVRMIDKAITARALERDVSRLVAFESRHVRHTGNRLAEQFAQHRLAALAFSPVRHLFEYRGIELANVYADLHAFADSSKTIVVGAHLDSHVRGVDYDPVTDPAPGADDNASGVAAVLAIAAACKLAARRRPLRKRIRFALFNAEEVGLVGSERFCQHPEHVTNVEAMIQMDMIGYAGRMVPPRPFEVHSGFYENHAVERASSLLGRTIARAANALLNPQLYASDDPAEGLSDHYWFHRAGCPAALVCEDFYGRDRSRNPAYHSADDLRVDAEYAASISRAVARTVLRLARQ